MSAVTDRNAFPKPPCPQCGAELAIEWLDATTYGDLARGERAYLPGQLTCPTNEDHNVRAAYAELAWPPGLSDDDKVWLRQHGTAWQARFT